MRPSRVVPSLLLAVGVTGGWTTTAAAYPDQPGMRALAMGGAGRADASANEGPLLNPAGMSLSRVYTLAGAYQFVTDDGGHFAHASVVDSTSTFQLAGGLYYNYRTSSPAGLPKQTGHEAGLALSFPLSDYLALGGTAKYFRLSGFPAEPDGSMAKGGVTFDAGIVARPAEMVSVAVVGYNLRDLNTSLAPVSIGYGVAVKPVPALTLAVDGLHDLTTTDDTRGVATTIGAGGEFTFGQRMAVRLGGGHDGRREHGYLSAGVVALSEFGALDASFHQDITGAGKQSFLAVGLRVFVPQP
jgi:hypothetical protein